MNPTTNFESLENLRKITQISMKIFKNSKDIAEIERLKREVIETSPDVLKILGEKVFSVFYPILKQINDDKDCYRVKDKEVIVNTLAVIFDKVKVTILPLFFNFYGFLLIELYDSEKNKIRDLSEEYKLSLVKCMTSLINSVDYDSLILLYTKENTPKLCPLLFAALELAKNEQYKILRISAVECIMALAHVSSDDDFNDFVLREQIATVFIFFLPGIARQLKDVALIDDKHGHKIPSVALKAWGRIVTLMMTNYNAADQRLTLPIGASVKPPLDKWKNLEGMKDYLKNTTRNPEWYLETDLHLAKIINEFDKLTHCQHLEVRFEIVQIGELITENCLHTMPNSISRLLQLIIALAGDDERQLADKSRTILQNLSEKLSLDEMKTLLEQLEDDFYNSLTVLPRKFNGIDESEQLVALNLVYGYLNLFGEFNLTKVLHSNVHLNQLLQTLLHLVEFDQSKVSILQDYATNELKIDGSKQWKRFQHFNNDAIVLKIKNLAKLLGKLPANEISADFLLATINYNQANRKEAIFLLNSLLAGFEQNETNFSLLKDIMTSYLDHWSLSTITNDSVNSLGQIQSSVVETCLLVEGLGKIALNLNLKFEQFLLKTLYLVLEKAGSGQPLIRQVALETLASIATATNLSSIPDLLNKNIDYFSFHLEKKLRSKKDTDGALNVLVVVLRYSTIEKLDAKVNLIFELLNHLNDARSDQSLLNSYLRVFKMFIKCVHRWRNVVIEVPNLRTKKEKESDVEKFEVGGIEPISDFSDSIMSKSAEEMWNEDIVKSKEEVFDEIDDEAAPVYVKPAPPIDIKLIIDILQKTLHFLPSKDKTRKILVLEILKDGIEVLKPFTDDLLPIVHQIWGPLVDRFKDFAIPMIINYSFQLLIVLARLSKDFIRLRTTKEVLPNIVHVLNDLSRESYLKDKGSAYRYTQAFKLQLTLLNGLGELLCDLDALQESVNLCMKCVFVYLSDKQPIPLQKSAIAFFTLVINYSSDENKHVFVDLKAKNNEKEFEKNTTLVFDKFIS